METAYIKTPLGIAKIIGDEYGISLISVSDEGEVSNQIPSVLQEAVSQLNDYFEGKRTNFDFMFNPKGTEFQQKVWKGLLEIPFGKTMSYLELSKKLGDVKAIRAVASANGKNHPAKKECLKVAKSKSQVFIDTARLICKACKSCIGKSTQHRDDACYNPGQNDARLTQESLRHGDDLFKCPGSDHDTRYQENACGEAKHPVQWDILFICRWLLINHG